MWKINKTVNFLIYALIIFGSFYRYLRVFPGFEFLNPAPYLLMIILTLFIFFYIISKRYIPNLLKEIFTFCFFLILTFIYSSIKFGIYSQLQFFSDLIFPCLITYYISIEGEFFKDKIRSFFIIFLIISFTLSTIEFYTTNILGFNFFAFADFWQNNENMGNSFHASKVNYLFLGYNIRPWGILAMPQASGSIFSFLAIYFLITLRIKKNKIDLIYLIISVMGIYFSGSRTALVALIIGLFLIYNKSKYINPNKLSINYLLNIILILFIILGVIYSLLVQDFGNSSNLILDDFYNKIIGYYFNFENIFMVLFGSGDNPNIFYSEIGLINNIIRIGFFPLILVILVVIKLINEYNKGPITFINKKNSITLLIISNVFLFSSLHYNTLRYPTNLLFALCIGLIIYNIKPKKQ